MNQDGNNVILTFDIDDTICVHKNRDYENAMPKLEVIHKINKLHNEGYTIRLYTSRGMISCGGNVKKAERKNKRTLIAWLNKHNVCYDELIFGKPISDVYIDDKAMNVEEFMKQDTYFELLKGGSNMKVNRLGNTVKKECTEDKLERMINWYRDTKDLPINSPNIHSFIYNNIFMEYIKGKNLYFYLSLSKSELSLLFKKLLDDINMFSKNKNTEYFDVNIHINILNKCIGIDEEVDRMIDRCTISLQKHSNILSNNASLCHGDLTLSNVQVDGKGDLWYLDSEYEINASSYLLDYAKVRMSLNNFEFHMGLSDSRISPIYLNYLDKYLKERGIFEIVYLLQYMFMIRVLRYKDEPYRNMLIIALKNMERIDKGGILLE